MKKLRWAMDGSFWDLDMSTPVTLEATAKPIPNDPLLPLGLSRATKLSRPKQIDFMQRFMAAPFVPSFNSSHGFALQRVLSLPLPDNLFTTLLGHFNVQKFVSSVKESRAKQPPDSSWMQSIKENLRDKSLYALGFCSEFLLTPDDTALFSIDAYGDKNTRRKKAAFRHRFPQHDLTVEAVSPGLFVDKSGTYWDVPTSVAVDLASLPTESGPSYHMCMHYNSGSPVKFEGGDAGEAPTTLLPGLSVKSAFLYEKKFEIWRSEAQKLERVQPYDILLSNPHISASGLLGGVLTTTLGDNSNKPEVEDGSENCNGLSVGVPGGKAALLADLFASCSFTAQHGNFQRKFLALTKFYGRLDFPSATRFVSGATQLAHDFVNSQHPSMKSVQAVVPHAFLSVQQQIAGPFSFRVDSGVTVDLRKHNWNVHVDEPIFAIEYALQVLGSAKATAWYSPKRQECMVELRFFER